MRPGRAGLAAAAGVALAVLFGARGGRPAAPVAARAVSFTVDCRAPARPISPLIYGVAGGDPDGRQWTMGVTASRWGGNPSSRYNWRLGNAWNAGADWFFANTSYGHGAGFSYEDVLADNVAHGVTTALTVPMLGWVAKDTRSYAFPVSLFGAQKAVAAENPDMGNGQAPTGAPLAAGPPTLTSVPAPPDFIASWIAAIRARDATRGRSVKIVFLDNEPTLWHINHRDVHPQPVGYDELLARTVAYAGAVRRADPGVIIAGPSAWGWTGYFYSAIDAVAGFGRAPDRRAHNGVPLLPWWLAHVRAEERSLGTRLIDLLDVHYYPAAGNPRIGVEAGGDTDRETNALRLRATRSLWDPRYRDESWIGEPVALIPRLRRWVDETAPGLGLSLGEYSFGAAGHISGGLAQAEALGRFASEGLTAAFYWRLPPPDSPVYWAFRAYRDFDGRGGRFLDLLAPVQARAVNASLFASRSPAGDHVVAIVLNLDPDVPAAATVDLSGCSPALVERAFVYGGPPGLRPAEPSRQVGGLWQRTLAPYTVTVLDWTVPARTP